MIIAVFTASVDVFFLKPDWISFASQRLPGGPRVSFCMFFGYHMFAMACFYMSVLHPQELLYGIVDLFVCFLLVVWHQIDV